MSQLVEYLVIYALLAAPIYAIAASGLVVTYTTTGIFNFAHGAIGMIVAFSYWQITDEKAWGLPVWFGLPFSLLVLAPALGWLLVAKGAGCFLAPDAALRSMARGTERGFAAGGTALLAVSAALAWVLWRG